MNRNLIGVGHLLEHGKRIKTLSVKPTAEHADELLPADVIGLRETESGHESKPQANGISSSRRSDECGSSA